MKPILTKTEKTTCEGEELTLVGEVYDNVLKKSDNYTIYSQIKILNDKGEPFHPGFSYPAQLSEHELQTELDFHKRNIYEKPKAYGK